MFQKFYIQSAVSSLSPSIALSLTLFFSLSPSLSFPLSLSPCSLPRNSLPQRRQAIPPKLPRFYYIRPISIKACHFTCHRNPKARPYLSRSCHFVLAPEENFPERGGRPSIFCSFVALPIPLSPTRLLPPSSPRPGIRFWRRPSRSDPVRLDRGQYAPCPVRTPRPGCGPTAEPPARVDPKLQTSFVLCGDRRKFS